MVSESLFLAGPRKWTRSSAPLFHSVLSPAFAAKRKQWRILAPRQAPNKVPVLCSAPRGSERWALSGQQRAVACDDRPAVTCCPGASHGHVSKRKITPFDFTCVLVLCSGKSKVLDIKEFISLRYVSCIISLLKKKKQLVFIFSCGYRPT